MDFCLFSLSFSSSSFNRSTFYHSDQAVDIKCAVQKLEREQLALAPTATYYGVEYIVCNDTMVSGENEIALKMWLQIV